MLKMEYMQAKKSVKDKHIFGETGNLVDSVIRYGSSNLRTKRYSKGDIIYGNENLSKDLMKTFQYEYPQIEFEEEESFQIQNPGGR